jgi:opacity protein-like surface antigen
MKKLLFITICTFCLLSVQKAKAQEEETDKKKIGLYVRANVGYGFATTPEVQGAERDGITAINIYGTTEPGVYPGMALGYMFNDYVGVELGAAYALGKDKLQDITYETLGLPGIADDLLTTITEYNFRTKQLRLTPAVVVRSKGKIAPYARFGMMIPVAGRTYTDVRATVNSQEIDIADLGLPIPFPGTIKIDGTVDAKGETQGAFSFGWDSSLGLDVQVHDMISVFAELHAVSLTIKSKQTDITEYNANIQLTGLPLSLEDALDLLPPGTVDLPPLSFDEMTEYDKVVMYEDMLDGSSNNSDYNANYDPNQPMDDLAQRQSYSSLGINLGVKVSF